MNLMLTNQASERLQFRRVKQSDFDAWMSMFDGPKVAEFFGLDSQKTNHELTSEFFKRVFYRYEHNLGGMNALIEKTTGKLVGQCGLLIQTIDDKKYLEIGYGILPEYWGMGYATEAAKKCRNHAFENDMSDSIISIINIDNYGSMAVVKKNGMRIERYIPDYKGSKINLWQIDQSHWKLIYDKPACEKCLSEIKTGVTAYHCSHNCTFCKDCSHEMDFICPNCNGTLEKR